MLKRLDIQEKQIFNILQKNKAMTKKEISLLTNIKLTTLNYIMQPLEQSKIIVRKCIGESSGGRKPILYDVNLADFFIIGIDISRLYTQVVITNLKIEILYKETFYMDKCCTPKETVNRIEKIVEKAYRDMNLDYTGLLGIGLGTVGPLNIKEGNMISPIYFSADGWSKVPIKSMLEEKFKFPIIIENGANMAAVAEYFYGIGKEFSNIAYFNCGVGIRTGTISSGNLIRTINDEEDAFGHMIIDIDGEQCKCGNFGCIECYSSIHAIVKKFSIEIKKGRHSIIKKELEDIEYRDICEAAEKNDNLAKEIITASALILGTGLANYVNLVNPGLVVLSGPMITNSKLFYDECIKTVMKKLHADKGKRILFSRGGHFKQNAISVGAAALVIERCLENGM